MVGITFIFAFVHVFLSVYSFSIREDSLKDVIFKNNCNFPPRYLGDDEYADKFEPCSQQTPNAVMEMICGNLILESKCDLKDVALPSTLVTLELFSDKGTPEEKASHLAGLCSYMENLPWTRENTCQNLCGNDAFFICDLYVAMDKVMRNLFMTEVRNYTHLDIFIHPGSLKFLYPFPPIGALHSPDLLGNCRTPPQDSVTNQLCTVMAEVAIQYVRARLAVRLHEGDFVRNVSSDWDPCTGFSRFSNFSTSANFISLIGNCAQLCKDQLGVCKTIYLGLEKYQQAAGSETSTATGSQLINYKSDAQVMNLEGTEMGKDSQPGPVTVEESHPKPVVVTGTGKEPLTGTETKPGSVEETGTDKELITGTETKPELLEETGTGKEPLTGTETKPGSVEETGTDKEIITGTEKKPESLEETGTGKEPVTGTETKPESAVETGTGKELPTGTETKPGSVEETGTGQELITVTEKKPGSVEETGTGEEPLSGTETKPESAVETGIGKEPLTGTETKPGLVEETGTGKELITVTETKPGSVEETGTGEEPVTGTETKPESAVETGTGKEPPTGTETKPGLVEETGTGKELITGTETKTTADHAEEQEEESFKPKETKLDQAVYINDEDDESSGSHFMAYFLVFIVLSIAGYILFHNKQKIIALVVEGKSAKGSRRPSTKDYKQLKTEDVMPSLEKSAYSKDYVF